MSIVQKLIIAVLAAVVLTAGSIIAGAGDTFIVDTGSILIERADLFKPAPTQLINQRQMTSQERLEYNGGQNVR